MTRKKIIGGIVLGAAVLSLVAALLARAGSPAGDGGRDMASTGIGPAVGIIEINGMIAGDRSATGLFGEGVSGSRTVMAQLRQASKNPDIKAVVLRMNSPGGTAAASQEIADEVKRLKNTGVKVVASMGDVAASGAYWIAASSDKIVANPGTITGSIGVLIQTTNYQGLLNKLGIGSTTFKSGAYKDMGSPVRPMTEEERQIFQSMVDDTYLQFIDTVARGRNLSPDVVRQLNGRVLTGRQAVEAGLVDQLGNFYDSISLAGEMAGLGKNPKTVNLTPKRPWWQIFDDMASSLSQAKSVLTGVQGYPGVLLLCPPIGM
ncbi:MAG: signal peptide peptidase SppA [Peptococcaceae bacterium]|nr:signal peptide peptidase SppA [Peptococcaceae bacterium]